MYKFTKKMYRDLLTADWSNVTNLDQIPLLRNHVVNIQKKKKNWVQSLKYYFVYWRRVVTQNFFFLFVRSQYWLVYMSMWTVWNKKYFDHNFIFLNFCYSSRLFNQRCFFTLIKNTKTVSTASVGLLGTTVTPITKSLRSSRRGLSLLLRHARAKISAAQAEQQNKNTEKHVVYIYTLLGATRRFFGNGAVLQSIEANEQVSFSFLVFQPSTSFNTLKIKRYKSIKKSYRRSIKKIERQSILL